LVDSYFTVIHGVQKCSHRRRLKMPSRRADLAALFSANEGFVLNDNLS
jgi:hypothetical protein